MVPWEVRAPFASGASRAASWGAESHETLFQGPLQPQVHRLLTWGGFLVVVTFVCRLLGYKYKVQARYNLLL